MNIGTLNAKDVSLLDRMTVLARSLFSIGLEERAIGKILFKNNKHGLCTESYYDLAVHPDVVYLSSLVTKAITKATDNKDSIYLTPRHCDVTVSLNTVEPKMVIRSSDSGPYDLLVIGEQ